MCQNWEVGNTAVHFQTLLKLLLESLLKLVDTPSHHTYAYICLHPLECFTLPEVRVIQVEQLSIKSLDH